MDWALVWVVIRFVGLEGFSMADIEVVALLELGVEVLLAGIEVVALWAVEISLVVISLVEMPSVATLAVISPTPFALY